MLKCAIYGRQSAGDEEVSESVEIQIANCKKLAETKNLQVIGEFQDLNASGKLYPSGYDELTNKDVIYQRWLNEKSSNKTSRSGLGELLKHVDEIDFIVVDDFTRLARPLTGSFLDAFLMQILLTNNVKVLTVKSGEIDFNSFNDTLITNLQSRINDNQIAIQRRKAMDGLKKLKDAGENLQGLFHAFGFRSTGKKHEVDVVPKEAEAIKFIYHEFLEGVSIAEIARRVNEKFGEDLKSKIGHTRVIRKALKRPYYCGYIYNSEGELIKSKQVYDKAFISFEDWDKVRKIFELRKIVKPRPKKKWNPLAGYVFCSKCGGRMNIRGTEEKEMTPFFTCRNHLFTKRKSCEIKISEEQHNKFSLGLRQAIAPILVIGALEKLKNLSQQVELKKELERLNVDLNNLVRKEKKFTEIFFKGLLEESVYEANLKEISSSKKELKTKIILLEAKSSANDDEETAIKFLRKVVAGTISHGEFEELLRNVIKKIFVFQNDVEIQTVLGNVKIPRQKINRYNGLPFFTFYNQGELGLSLYYYYGLKRPMVNFYSPNKTKIATLGDLKIYYIKD